MRVCTGVVIKSIITSRLISSEVGHNYGEKGEDYGSQSDGRRGIGAFACDSIGSGGGCSTHSIGGASSSRGDRLSSRIGGVSNGTSCITQSLLRTIHSRSNSTLRLVPSLGDRTLRRLCRLSHSTRCRVCGISDGVLSVARRLLGAVGRRLGAVLHRLGARRDRVAGRLERRASRVDGAVDRLAHGVTTTTVVDA
ncbi:hypothetical protein PFISCL1PPCAC_1467, partial [Pristionchus fissidentatus]